MDNNLLFRFVLVGTAAFVLYYLVTMYNGKKFEVKVEKFQENGEESAELNGDPTQSQTPGEPEQVKAPLEKEDVNMIQPSEEDIKGDFKSVDFADSRIAPGCFPRDRLQATDLLPQEAVDPKFTEVNPPVPGELEAKNFLTAGYTLGIDTIGSSLRNASYDLRSSPPNPSVVVSPWIQKLAHTNLIVCC